MDMTPYVDRLCREPAIAVEASGEGARTNAERPAGSLGSLGSAAGLAHSGTPSTADEINRELAPGRVDMRPRGLDPHCVTTSAPTADAFEIPGANGRAAAACARSGPPPAAATTPEPHAGGASPITPRPSRHHEPGFERAAGRRGPSTDARLGRTATALEPANPAHRHRGTSWSARRRVGHAR
ncbi:hypothetical protein [Embleya sp. NPDC001921]